MPLNPPQGVAGYGGGGSFYYLTINFDDTSVVLFTIINFIRVK